MPATCDISSFLKGLAAASAETKSAAARAVEKFAHHVLGEAQQLAPQSPSNQYMESSYVRHGVNSKGEAIDLRAVIQNPGWTGHSGALRDSATALPVEITNDMITCVIGFNTVYAAAQHEHLEFMHTTGQAKYLETAVRANVDRFIPFIKAEINWEGA